MAAGAYGRIRTRIPYHVNVAGVTGALAPVDLTARREDDATLGDGVTPASAIEIQNLGPADALVSFDGTNSRTLQADGIFSIEADVRTIWLGTAAGAADIEIVCSADRYRT